MLFWLTLVLFLIFIGMFYFYDSGLAMIGAIFLGITMVVMIVCLSFTYIGISGRIAADHQRYESLVYQAENQIYENDNDIGKQELVCKIQDWNEDLAIGKTLQNDFWVGIFYPNVFDQFDFIPIEIIGG